MKRRALWLSLFTTLLACGETIPRTQVMLVIDAEPGIRTTADNVHIVVRGGTGGSTQWQERLDRTLNLADHTWPLSLALVPLNDDASRVYEATATARTTAGTPIAIVRAISGYRNRQTLMLRLVFEDACTSRVSECTATQTCRAGECVNADIAVTSLDTFKPGATSDAGGTGGGGAVDAGTDSGVDASIDSGGMNNINECLSTNVCTADYPCQDLADGYTCRGQFADWPPAYAPGAFTVNGDATVSDSRTGLRWQRDVGSAMYTWDQAKSYCANLSLAGMVWRLPSKSELESLLDDSHYPTVPDSAAFPSVQLSDLWSSSPSVGSVRFAHVVHFYVGRSTVSDISNTYPAQCVRSDAVVMAATGSGGAPPGRYTQEVEGTVLDTRTLLTWQQSVDTGMYTWEQAQTFCAELSLSGGRWRLPSRAELLTLVDPTAANPAIDPAAFPSTPSLYFWSSSPVLPNAISGWVVDFAIGGTGWQAQASDLHAVRCAR